MNGVLLLAKVCRGIKGEKAFYLDGENASNIKEDGKCEEF